MEQNSSMEQQFIQKLLEIIDANLEDEKFGVNELAAELRMSRATLHRKSTSIINKSATEFIRETRLTKAKELLQNKAGTVSEISFRVGFGSVSYFNRCFHEHFGYPPGEVLKGQHKVDQELTQVIKKSFFKKAAKTKLIFVIPIVILLSVVIILKYNYDKVNSKEKSIAVLPFNNLSSNLEYQYFSDGITLDIIYRLSQINAFKIVSTMSAAQNYGSKNTAHEIARKLNVNYILTGSVQQYGQHIRIIIQLIDTRKDIHLRSLEFDNEFANIFTLQSDIAKQVAVELQEILSLNEIERIEKTPTQNLEAYNLYLKGRFFWNKRTEEGLKNSVEYFSRAVEIDPDYALAWAGLADSYQIMSGYGFYPAKKEGEEKAKSYVKKALEIDNKLAEGHATFGFLLCYTDWKWDEAEKELLTAIQLNPNYAFAHQIYAQLSDIKGDYKRARSEIDLGLSIDPLSPVMHYISATLYYNAGNFEKSILECKENLSLENNSKGMNWWFFKNYYRLGDEVKALNELQKILSLNEMTKKYVDTAKIVYEKSGMSGLIDWFINIEAETNTENFVFKTQLDIYKIELYAIAGKNDKVLTLLEKAIETKTESDRLLRLINNLDYKPLRNEPRFKEIITKLGLE